jgi:hypothetical protein
LECVRYTGDETVVVYGEFTGRKYKFVPLKKQYIDARDAVFWIGTDLEVC